MKADRKKKMILWYELKKILFNKIGFVIIATIIIQVVFSFIPHYVQHNYSPEVYRRYIETYGGSYTEKTYDIIKQRQTEIENLIEIHDTVVSDYRSDLISLEEYENHNIQYNRAIAEQSTVYYLLEKCEYYNSLDRPAVLFYDTDWFDFLSNDSYDYIIAITIIIVIIPVFSSEYMTGSRNLIITTSQGKRKSALSKLLICGVFVFIFAFAMYIIKVIPVISGKSAAYSNLPVYNLLGYSFESDISIIEYYISDSLIKSFQWCVLSLFVCTVSVLVKNTTFVFFISLLFVIFPSMLYTMVSGKVFDIIFTSYALKSHYNPQTNILNIGIIIVVKALLYCIITERCWCARSDNSVMTE